MIDCVCFGALLWDVIMAHTAVNILLPIFQLSVRNGQRMTAAAAKKEASKDVFSGIFRRASVAAANLLDALK